MASLSVATGLLLVGLGFAGFSAAGFEIRAVTALIPALFGLLIGLCGILAYRERRRKRAMRAAAVIGLLGFLVPAARLGMVVAKGGFAWELGTTMLVVSTVLCLGFFVVSVLYLARRRRRIQYLTILASLPAIALFGYSCSSGPPENLGVRDGRLSPCPSSPNCVSSLEEGDKYVEPLVFEGPQASVLARLADCVRSMDGASIITFDGNYLHAEYRTPLLRFIDDVEFLVDVDSRLIHVRSASRVGYSDLGTNRERVEAIREAFAAAERADQEPTS